MFVGNQIRILDTRHNNHICKIYFLLNFKWNARKLYCNFK